MKKLSFFIAMFLLISSSLFAQVSINATGANPDSKAMLDVSSTEKGMLVPRMTQSQRTAITLPSKGLLVYQIDGTEGFYYFDGTAWTRIASGTYTESDPVVKAINGMVKSNGTTISSAVAGTDYLTPATGWNLTGNAGTTPGTNFIGTTDNKALIFKVYNSKSGEINYDTYNTSFGYQALNSISTGFSNTANGVQALYSNTTGYQNTANGYMALYSNTTGYNNTAVGLTAGRFISNNTTANSTSSNSVYLGASTKAFANAQTNEIVIGYDATGAGSNSVTLGNTTITSTVLRGNVKHYGTTSGYVGLQAPAAPTSYSLTLPTAAPASNGQVLSATTAGVMSWATPTSGTVTAVSGTAPIVSSGGNTPAISISAASTSAAGSMSAADKTKLDAITGTNTGNQTITLTGDVTGSGTGSFAATIAGSSVSNAKMANMAANTIKLNNTTAAAAPADLSLTANTFPSRKSTGNITAYPVTDFAFDILNDADAPTVRTTIGAGTGNGTVTGVTGTAPIVSTGGISPVISITAATASVAGSMSAADKTELDAATNANTPGTLVARDASGNFTAGTITAALTGNATTATTSTNIAGGLAGSVPYQSAANATTLLAKGTAGQVLTMNSGATAPQWSTPTTGTVTGVSGTAPIVSSGGAAPAISISSATTSAAGSMSAADKTKLDGSTHAIGDLFGGGTVFYIWDNGRHGLIAYPDDVASTSVWSTRTALSSNAIRDGIYSGFANTERMINIEGAGTTYAATYCANYMNGGFGDWYLPSKYELNLLYQNKTILGISSGNYWSSTEYNNSNAWYQNFASGSTNFQSKNMSIYVRAIRAF